MRTVFGAELSLGDGAPYGRSGSARSASAGAGPRPGGLPPAVPSTGGRAPGRRREGQPRYDFEALTEAAGGHWQIFTGCRKGMCVKHFRRMVRRLRRRHWRDLVDRFGPAGSVSSSPITVTRSTTNAMPRWPRWRRASVSGSSPPPARTSPGRRGGGWRWRWSSGPAVPRRAAGWLAPLGGAHLRSGDELAQVFAQNPEVVTAAAELGEECAFGLQLIAPQLPPFDVPSGQTEDSWLRELAMVGAAGRYGPRADAPRAYAQIERELDVIAALKFPGYFLVVHDITRFCRENKILCQGRGSAANSAVCYALGITASTRSPTGLLFERFLSPARDGPPDIDIDIESDRREQVIQYVYGQLRPRLRGAGGQRHHLPRPVRCGTWPAPWGFRRASRTPGASRSAGGTAWPTRRRDGIPEVLDLAGADRGPATAHGYPLRRHGDLRPPDRRRVPGGVGADGESQCAAVGQRRLRRNRFGEVRPAGSGHALGPALRHRPGRRAQGHRGRPGQAGPVRGGGLRDAVAGRFGRRVPGGVPGADGDPAAAAAPHFLRPGGGGRADPARAHPGRLGAPLHSAPQRARTGHLRPSVDGGGPRRRSAFRCFRSS